MTVTDNRERYNARRRITPTPKVCEWCGGSFTPKRSDARTCGDAHRQALNRWEGGKSETPPPVTAIRKGGEGLAAEVSARDLQVGDVFAAGALAGKRITAVTDQCPDPDQDGCSTCFTRAGAWVQTERGRTWSAVDKDELVRVDR